MRRIAGNTSGQLLLPVLGLLFLYGLFLAGYVGWCRTQYWTLRMDVAARATALSAARTQAALLNTIATTQMAENILLQKLRIPFTDANVGHVQVSARFTFEELNAALTLAVNTFEIQAYNAARAVAKADGADRLPLLIGTLSPKLKPKKVVVEYFAGLYPVGGPHTYEKAYYAREWFPNDTQAQPDHRMGWTACHGSVCGTAWTRLWLDVDPRRDPMHLSNGGFPTEKQSIWRDAGIQCLYPQFNARLMARQSL